MKLETKFKWKEYVKIEKRGHKTQKVATADGATILAIFAQDSTS